MHVLRLAGFLMGSLEEEKQTSRVVTGGALGPGGARPLCCHPTTGRKSGGISLHVCSLKEGPQGPEGTFLCVRRFAQQGVQEGFMMSAL